MVSGWHRSTVAHWCAHMRAAHAHAWHVVLVVSMHVGPRRLVGPGTAAEGVRLRCAVGASQAGRSTQRAGYSMNQGHGRHTDVVLSHSVPGYLQWTSELV